MIDFNKDIKELRYNVAMIQIECFAIENPCQQICRFNRQHICKVCHRKREEKKAWNDYSEQEKRAVLRKCHRRKIAYLRAERQLILQQKRQSSKPIEQLTLFTTQPAHEYHRSPNIGARRTTRDDEHPQLSLFDD